ncbi:tripartite tricarboxylate transporter TctB family protein [Desertibaculum subflavum]|uniref:tripartite tricarboxylate transporter TctB family protein n=1 Tax=Desertibaculum subflavum TaxID=2268458 RepID=UPI0013C40FA1
MTVETDSFASGSPPPSPRADLVTAAVFVAISLTVLALALQMPTFTDRGGDPYTAPGIVPGFYGLVLAGISSILAVRALRRGALKRQAETAAPSGLYSNARLAIAAGLGLVYTVGLVGRVPFWLASALFIAAFVGAFEWDPGATPKARLRRLAVAAVIGLVAGGAAHAVFQEIFLVRLP